MLLSSLETRLGSTLDLLRTYSQGPGGVGALRTYQQRDAREIASQESINVRTILARFSGRASPEGQGKVTKAPQMCLILKYGSPEERPRTVQSWPLNEGRPDQECPFFPKGPILQIVYTGP